MSQRIAVIDYGMGNLHSVASALRHVAPGAEVVITSSASQVAEADRVIFPGVGAIRDCIAEIKRQSYDAAVQEAYAAGTPILAICVGMQSLMRYSEENEGVDCLNVLPGEVRFFSSSNEFAGAIDEAAPSQERLKVPHMGWNQVRQTCDHALWRDIPQDSRFYFVHSYYVDLELPEFSAGETHYGLNFTAAIASRNLFSG